MHCIGRKIDFTRPRHRAADDIDFLEKSGLLQVSEHAPEKPVLELHPARYAVDMPNVNLMIANDLQREHPPRSTEGNRT